MNSEELASRFLYWLDEQHFGWARERLQQEGYRLSPTLLTPCQVLKSRGNALIYAPPQVWSRICVRQGTWYHKSEKQGMYMLMSDHRLPETFDEFLDVQMTVSDFMPETLPDEEALQEIVESEEYQENKPDGWEDIGIKDAAMFKLLFTPTGFWGSGDNLKKFWRSQKANHANFLSRKYTTELEGKKIPYRVTGNAGVCSSCVEFFNTLEPQSRKLVRACPGAVIFGKVERDVYYDIKPLQESLKASSG